MQNNTKVSTTNLSDSTVPRLNVHGEQIKQAWTESYTPPASADPKQQEAQLKWLDIQEGDIQEGDIQEGSTYSDSPKHIGPSAEMARRRRTTTVTAAAAGRAAAAEDEGGGGEGQCPGEAAGASGGGAIGGSAGE